MTSKSSPIIPPPQLVQQWFKQAHESADPANQLSYYDFIATAAAQWGADQELEACCRWLPKLPPWSGNDLRRHRRPEPPSLKEQALAVLDDCSDRLEGAHENTIRRALEALDD